MPKTNRITASRPKDNAKARLTDTILGDRSAAPPRVFHYGQVIDSKDPKNANRLRIRIPLIDDGLYTNDSGVVEDSIGDDKLPWALASNGRGVDTPENGTVVVVALFEPLNPQAGRIWITAVPEMSDKDIFDKDRLLDELNQNKWKNAESAVGVKFNSSPELRNRPSIPSKSRVVNYPTGIRGKDKNKLLFDKATTTLVQNEGDQTNESKVVLTEKMFLGAKTFEVIANQSTQKQTPVFADPLFQYLSQLENIIDQTIIVLNTMPSLWMASVPNTPNPQMGTILGQWQQVKLKLQQIKIIGNGHSKYITIT